MSIIDSRASALGRLLAVAALIVGPVALVPQQTMAGAQDYRFELASPPVTSGSITTVKVRLLHVSDGKPVSGAIIVETRFDMGPENMASMTAPARTTPSAAPGIYQVEAEPSIAGNWALTLAAKVQSEPDTVRGTVTVPVAK